MANNTSSRQAGHAARYVVARVLRGLFWCLKYTVILPLATMALMALFVLWKDNTTPGKLLVDELQKIQFNRLDFTNFYEDLMNNQKIPDSGVLTQKVKEQIADQLKQAGQ
ncbi:TPA: hypothetical protein IFC86_004485 [Escherichia coli]|nr:hypothetical protein [Escherichia coli]